MQTRDGERRGFRRLLPYLGRHKRRVALGLLLVPVFTGIQLYIPQLFGDGLRELERVAAGADVEPPSFWLVLALTICGLQVAHSSIRYGARVLVIGLSRRVEEELRGDLFRHLQRLPMRWFDEARIGDLVSRATQDIEQLRFIGGPMLFFGLSTVILLPGAVTLLWLISWTIPVTVLACFAGIIVALRFAFPQLAARSRVVQDAQADISAKAQEDFSGIRVLHAFAREKSEIGAFAKLADGCRDAQVSMAYSRALLHSSFVAASLVSGLCLILVAFFERLGPAELLTAYIYLQSLNWPLIIIGWLLQSYHRAKAAADRLDEVFDVLAEYELGVPEDDDAADVVGDTQQTAEHRAGVPAIEARGLSFDYADGTRALENVSFRLEQGKALGICGPIGSGKSTLIALLTRLYDPPANRLFIDGVDVHGIERDSLRGRFAVATQDPFLFSDTLHGNVGFGVRDAHEPLVREALDDASLDLDENVFPDGLEQLVGERGVSLSGGQKQRVSLARALMSDRDILVLDDTLSAVDHDTEKRILDRLRQRPSQTRILVAHRLAALVDADLILVLDEGRLVDSGTHEELLARGEWYAQTWAQQQRAS